MSKNNFPVANTLTIPDALNKAYAHWNAGQAPQAEQLCLRVLAVAPDQTDARHLLGLMAHAYGQADVAIAHLREACRSPIAPALYCSNLAEMCRQQGLLPEAESFARRAIASDSKLVGAWNNLGIILQEAGKLEASLECLQRVAELLPDSADAHNNLANTYKRLGNGGAAQTHYRRALELNPDYAQALSNLALTLSDDGLHDEALASVRRAIEIDPQFKDAYQNLAKIEHALLRHLEAQGLNTAAVPAGTMTGGGLPDAAALEALRTQAQALLQAQRYAEAEAMLRQPLASGSGPIVLWKLLVHALRPQGKVDEARTILEMVARTVPGDLHARFDLAEVMLLQGDFDAGWREYRFRYQLTHTALLRRHVQKPRWDGQSIAGQTLLIHDEQGYGDTFQFLRLVAQARARSGARVILEVNPESYPLAARSGGFDEIIRLGMIPPAFDCHCELMSLPMALGLQLSDLPVSTRYLRADPDRVEHWKKRLASLPRPLVGLVWAGRPTHTNDARRSLALSDLAPLAQQGVTFVALQKGPAAAQASDPPAGMNIVPLSDEIRDFDDTAAILTLLDVLVSVDSSPVHLAGALGCPAWVMLPFVPDWRWLLDRGDTPWYPSVRLFRQCEPDTWGPVLEDIAVALGKLRDGVA
ncbi:tetratricopeptide repeat protein [Achromobacter seleniivolatilans]|uniref:Tetratricopeptide repeat protein n=1 Tax=Achromobacter seleniivolatilans TaxID=3047478 RepID=A0ABY9M2C9_9BURK|nr:tetratricopeptide repeat protein [Achromobacter sp. R39]WMD21161.1 tetratricopeptide repeat protein [Achromobacter sp. R39]